MMLFDLAMDYALLRLSSWGHMMVCQCKEGFSYRVHAKVPVFCVPGGPAGPHEMVLLAWLFARHSLYVGGSGMIDVSDIWKEAEDIFTDLCLMAEMPCDYAAFEQERAAADRSFTVAVQS